MAGTPRDIATIESYFETGDKPTQQQFYDTFASFIHYLQVKQAAGTSQSDIMSQKAITDAITAAVTALKGGVGTEGDTLKKLYDLIVSVGQFAGEHDASGGALPSTGTGASGAIDKGDYWIVSVAGTITGLGDLDIGDVIFANVSGADDASEFFYLPFSSSIPDATPTTKGIAKLFNTYTPQSPRTDGAVDEARVRDALKSLKRHVNKTAHNFSVGHCLTINPSTGAIELFMTTITAEDDSKRRLLGIVSDIIDANNFLYVPPGGVIDTLSGLTPGANYYVNEVDASLTTTLATGAHIRHHALVALSSTSAIVLHNSRTVKQVNKTKFTGFNLDSGYSGEFLIINTSGGPVQFTLTVQEPGFFIEAFVSGSSYAELLADESHTVTAYGWSVLSGAKVPHGTYFKLICQSVNAGLASWVWIVIPPIYTIESDTGNELRFDRNRKYGLISAPITGNLTLNTDIITQGVVVLIIHNDSAEPSYPSQFKKAAGSGNYVPGANNYIYAHCVEASTIIYTITQVP